MTVEATCIVPWVFGGGHMSNFRRFAWCGLPCPHAGYTRLYYTAGLDLLYQVDKGSTQNGAMLEFQTLSVECPI